MSPHSSSRRTPRPAAGFTIIEVMMAAVILVVGFMGMIQAITIGSEMMATARRQTLAAQIITHEIAKLRMLPWDDPAGTNDIAGLTTTTPVAYTTYAPDVQFTEAINASGVSAAKWQITRTVSDPTANLRAVTFTISWEKGGTDTAATTASGSWLNRISFYRPTSIKRVYTRSMSAYFGKYGLNLNIQRS